MRKPESAAILPTFQTALSPCCRTGCPVISRDTGADAAGLAYPQSGEGIRPAVESGLMAAAVIANANGNYRRDSLLPYRDQITARFGTPRTSGAAGWLPAGWLQALAGRLLKTEWFNRSVVLDKWFLHADTDALVV